MHTLPHSVPPTLQQATTDLCLCQTPGHSQSLVQSLLLSPGSWHTQDFVCALSESVSIVLCMFWQLYDGVNDDFLQEAYAIPRSAAPRVPAHVRPLLTHTSTGDTQTLKGRSGSVSVGSPGVHKFLFEPSEHLWQYGV